PSSRHMLETELRPSLTRIVSFRYHNHNTIRDALRPNTLLALRYPVLIDISASRIRVHLNEQQIRGSKRQHQPACRIFGKWQVQSHATFHPQAVLNYVCSWHSPPLSQTIGVWIKLQVKNPGLAG